MNIKEDQEIGKTLRQCRERLEMSKQEIANYLSIPRPSVVMMERGLRKISVREIKKLSLLYKRSVDWILNPDKERKEIDTSGLSDKGLEMIIQFADFLRFQERMKT